MPSVLLLPQPKTICRRKEWSYDFSEALEFSKRFPRIHPKIFRGFTEWGTTGPTTEAYIIVADATLADEPYSDQLKDYLENHKLKTNYVKNYLIIFTQS